MPTYAIAATLLHIGNPFGAMPVRGEELAAVQAPMLPSLRPDRSPRARPRRMIPVEMRPSDTVREVMDIWNFDVAGALILEAMAPAHPPPGIAMHLRIGTATRAAPVR